MENRITALTPSWLLSLDPCIGTIPDALVAVQRGVIVYAGPREEAPALPENAEMIDLPHHILFPGLVNAHTHLPMTLLRGLADDLPLHTWLQEHVFPAEQRLMSPERVQIGTALGVAELLLSGTTCCGDGYFREDIVLETAASLGLRGVFAQGVMDFPAPGIPDMASRFEVLSQFLSQHSDPALQAAAVFAHSPYTCSAQTLCRAKAIADDAERRFFIHVAETQDECESCREQHDGMSPIAYLADLGVLDAATTLIHAVHVDERDMDIIAERGSAVVVNTESNMKLASGVAPLPGLLARGIPVGLGTDGAASNNDLDMLGELGMTARLHKLVSGDPTELNAEDALLLATVGGARALGLAHRIGSISTGSDADLVAVDIRRPNAHPLYDPASHVVHAASAADVDTVMIQGRTIVRGGKGTTFDTRALAADVRRCLDSLGSGADECGVPGT